MAPMPSVQALERALDILEAFSPGRFEMGIAELSQKVNLSAPTVSRLVRTLAARGYLVQNPGNKKYRLSLKLLDLVAVVQAERDLYRVSLPVLFRLRNALKETVYLDVRDGGERVCFLSLPGLRPVSTVVPVGQRSPLYAGADARTLLAFLDDEEIAGYLANAELKAYASNTITDRDRLWEEIRSCRRYGVAVSVNEFHQGSACVSAPVRDFSGMVAASLSVSFPDSRADRETLLSYARSVRQAAGEISAALGCRVAQNGRSRSLEELVDGFFNFVTGRDGCGPDKN